VRLLHSRERDHVHGYSALVFPSAKKDLDALSSQGHFLKGLAATIGASRLPETCGKVEQYALLRGGKTEAATLTKEAALEKIQPLLKQAREEHKIAEAWLKKFYAGYPVPAAGT
jgi:HPt (histidine-containing phosphotransfer) domain-containing protein